ncbi:MAG: hypothetical protein JXB33_08495, partial [Clostridia bacterium]|nr:hypothetical protein [Clostridia bacterium]
YAANAKVVECGFNDETYIDFAEKTLRSLIAMGIQRQDGFIRDPFEARGITYRGRELERFYYHAAARFCGALGQMIQAGRMLEFTEELFRSYFYLMNILAYDFEPELYAEFWVKELVFAYKALLGTGHPGLDAGIWEKVSWRKYGFCYFNNFFNSMAFALASEACRINAGLGGEVNFFDAWAPVLIDKFDDNSGMFLEPGAPLSYDLVARQQMLFAIQNGASGEYIGKTLELCGRGAESSLYMQSSTGQMPFGGRTNQFLCMDAQLACYFEMMCNESIGKGEHRIAGIFKRAAGKALMSTEPWVRMEPYRHIRQGFHPSLGHGVDSGGVYTVYGLLMASLMGTAYHESQKSAKVQCYEAPSDAGGYVFITPESFHKIFAACGGYHIEIDTAGDPEKDATGLGRLHKEGAMPETALSGSFAAGPSYSFAIEGIKPEAAAIGPAWMDSEGTPASLAGLDRESLRSGVVVLKEDEDCVEFIVTYETDGEAGIEEKYSLSADGLAYDVKGNLDGLHITVPVIMTDGDAKGIRCDDAGGPCTEYRGSVYRVVCEDYEYTGKLCANRNGIYEILKVRDRSIRLVLNKAGLE